MAKVLSLLTGEKNPILRTPSLRVTAINKEVKKLLEDMQSTVRVANGIGLAAPQVGHNLRLIVAQISGSFLSMINPEILEFSAAGEIMEEGCLSLPGLWGEVERPYEILMRFTSLKGIEHTFQLKGMDARVIQHEIDHLDGILFLDRLKSPPYERNESAADAKKA